jgi:prepilin-type N-terminal cleavage/methylation domain-containing protein
MVLTNIKNKQKESGFTIVELLVVIVVIGILAAITIVSYTGITAKANASKAQSAAKSAQSTAETFFAENNYYPGTNATFHAGATAKLPAGTVIVADAASTPVIAGWDTTFSQVALSCVTAAASCSAGDTAKNITGLRFAYWDPSGTPGIKYVYVGTATSGSTYVY